MSKRMEGTPQMPSQGNEWVSREEYDEKYEQLNATLAKMIELLEENKREIAELRAEKESRLGAAASLAANPEDDDSCDSEDAHADEADSEATRVQAGEELEDEPSVGVTTNTIDSLQLDDEGKKKEKKGHPVVKGFAMGVLATAVIATGVGAGLSKLANNDSPKSPDIKLGGDVAGDYLKETIKDVQANAEENAVAKAEEARQQQVAETMGMSVEDMHAVADRHGVEYNKIGTAEAHNQMRDGMESSYNLSEKVDLEGMSEAERSERSKQEIEFANMNNKYVTAQISSARLGASDGSDAELTQRLFSQYEENDAVWQEHAKENAKLLKESTYSTRSAGTAKTYTYGTENAWDGLIERQYVVENSGGETVYIIEVANGNMKIQFKDGCIQAVWVEEAAQPRQHVERRTVVQQEVVQQKERHQEKQSQQYSWERKGGEIEHRQNDSKDPKANDTQQNADKNFEDDSKANDDAPTYGGQKNPDTSAKSGNTDNNPDNGSEVVPDDKNGSIGGKQDAKPGQQDWGGGGAADNGQDKTTAKSGDQGGSGEDTTGGNQTDSGSGSKETGRRSSSQHRSSEWKKGGSKTIDENGNTTEKSYSSASDTGWVNDNNDDTHSGGNQVNGDVELQNIVVSGT